MFVDEMKVLREHLTPQELKRCQDVAEGHLEIWEDQDLMKKIFDLYNEGILKGEMPYTSLKEGPADTWLAARLERVFRIYA